MERVPEYSAQKKTEEIPQAGISNSRQSSLTGNPQIELLFLEVLESKTKSTLSRIREAKKSLS